MICTIQYDLKFIESYKPNQTALEFLTNVSNYSHESQLL